MNQEQLNAIRHSAAHMLAAAVLKLYPGTTLGIGPVIDDGFYYDFQFPEGVTVSDKELPKIEKQMKKLIAQNLKFEGRNVSAQEARDAHAEQPFKCELIDELDQKGEAITLYTSGAFTDLCRGGHVEQTKEIPTDGIKLHSIAGAYWKGSEKNPMLSRIYGYLFATREELAEHMARIEDAKQRDHKKLGKELDLFTFSDTIGKGLPLWTEKGTTIRREIERFIVDEEIKRGYKHVTTPAIAKLELYEKSGHYPYYKDSMYSPIEVDGERFMLRPMSCPHHFELYLRRKHSYKELPERIAELVQLYRYEQSGELSGLLRVRSFQLADAHIICTDPAQAGQEVNGALDLIEFVAQTFGLEKGKQYSYRLSLGNREDEKKYYKDDAAWDKAESILREVIKKRDVPFVESANEAAFYGPKVDVQMKNVLGKEDTAFTVQYDFVMPKRFHLKYIEKDGTEKEAVVVHRSSVGAIERIVAFLIEHFAGAFPVWLSPVQVAIIAVGESHQAHCAALGDEMRAAGVRVLVDVDNETVGKKIRNAAKMKIPYMLVIGDKEMGSSQLMVRKRGEQEAHPITKDAFVSQIQERIQSRSLDL